MSSTTYTIIRITSATTAAPTQSVIVADRAAPILHQVENAVQFVVYAVSQILCTCV